MAIIQLKQTKEELLTQVEDLLIEQDLPVDENHKQLVAGLIFQSQAHTDEIDTDAIGQQARGMLARRLLYFIMKPEAEAKEKATDDTAKDQEADSTRS